MRKVFRSFTGNVVAGFAIVCAVSIGVSARQTGDAVTVDADDIGGVVRSANGLEAGVWVIAETTDLPTRFAKIVVTDDRGRYLVPDLPKGNYNLWVRGYGLVDSSKVRSATGRTLNLTAVVAPNPRAAAQYYPAGYWASLLQIPDKSEFPGTGPQGNGIAPGMKMQAQWLAWLKNGSCYTCHQIGNKATRELPQEFATMKTTRDAWARRIQSGQAGPDMLRELTEFGAPRALQMFADWTDRIAAGELPPVPPRPQGAERNVVITQWHWADEKTYMHDQISTDRRRPTVNANGPIYGAPELSQNFIPVLDLATHTPSKIPVTPRDSRLPIAPNKVLQPSPYWGNETIWTSRMDIHNQMLDQDGRVWMTARVRPPQTPQWCRQGSSHPSAKLYPINESTRQAAVYDPKTRKLTEINTCFDTHHLNFTEDADNTLWFNGYGSPYFGWINTKVFNETGDEQKSQGWTPIVLDTNGNGKRDAYVEAGQPMEPAKDTRLGDSLYTTTPAADGSIWGSVLGFPGAIIRMVPGANPTDTSLSERYELPWLNPNAPIQGYSPRGMDVDRNGVAWVALGSGHLASFDRRKCNSPLNGPKATGQHCPEGWTLYTQPLPQFKGLQDNGSSEGSYYAWVDQFDTLGLGANTPIATGNQSDAFLALQNGKWVTLRVPYPMGFYTKGLDGRIDDPNGGWKGRGLWSTVSTRAPFHMETGKGTPPIAMKFQIRPNPLAK
jgi:hypothetical protein